MALPGSTHSQGEPRPLGAQPLPRVLERAASKVAHLSAPLASHLSAPGHPPQRASGFVRLRFIKKKMRVCPYEIVATSSDGAPMTLSQARYLVITPCHLRANGPLAGHHPKLNL